VLEWTGAGLAERFAELYEADPSDPRVSCDGNVLSFRFTGGLTLADRNLLETGAAAEAKKFRERFLEAVAPQLREVVEARAKVEVSVFFAAFDGATRTTNLVFVIDQPLDAREEQWAALRNWGRQVRRNSRRLRQDHRSSAESHGRLRTEFHRREEEKSQLPQDADSEISRISTIPPKSP
jgi:hypothetical protein